VRRCDSQAIGSLCGRQTEANYSDRNARWHRYELIEPSHEITTLLDEIDRDPTGIFWG